MPPVEAIAFGVKQQHLLKRFANESVLLWIRNVKRSRLANPSGLGFIAIRNDRKPIGLHPIEFFIRFLIGNGKFLNRNYQLFGCVPKSRECRREFFRKLRSVTIRQLGKVSVAC